MGKTPSLLILQIWNSWWDKAPMASLDDILVYFSSYSLPSTLLPQTKAYTSLGTSWNKVYMTLTHELSDAITACVTSSSISHGRLLNARQLLNARLISAVLETSFSSRIIFSTSTFTASPLMTRSECTTIFPLLMYFLATSWSIVLQNLSICVKQWSCLIKCRSGTLLPRIHSSWITSVMFSPQRGWGSIHNLWRWALLGRYLLEQSLHDSHSGALRHNDSMRWLRLHLSWPDAPRPPHLCGPRGLSFPLNTYIHCGSIDDALRVYKGISSPNVF